MERALEFEFSIQSSVYGATTVAKVSLFSTWTRMRRRLRQNATNVFKSISDVQYIYPTSDIQYLTSARASARARARARVRARAGILDVRYRYRTSDIYGRPIYILDVRYRYQMSDIGTRMLDIGTRMSDIGTRMSDIGTRMSGIGTRMSDIGTRMSDIDIGRRIYILEVRYIYIGRPI